MENCKICNEKANINTMGYCPNCALYEEKAYEELELTGSSIFLESNKQNTSLKNKSSDAFLYIRSFLLPVIGIISGSILLTTDNKKSIGRNCVLLSLAGVLIAGLIMLVI